MKKVQNDMQPKTEADGNGDGTKEAASVRKTALPPKVMDIIWPALQIGSLSGASGTLVGGFAGIIRSNTPVLFALASGIQWFTLGSSFTVSRGIIVQAIGVDRVTPREKVFASAIAGSIGGAAGGLLRGRANVLPGAVMFALFGATGQVLYNRADARQNAPEIDRRRSSLEESWLNSRWSPMKVLTDQEYEDMLQEKLLRVNADIALIDERIEAVRDQERAIMSKPAGEGLGENVS